MIAFKRSSVFLLLLLTACVPKKPLDETTQNLEAPPASATPTVELETETPAQSTSTTKRQALTKKEATTSKTKSSAEDKKQAKADHSAAAKLSSWEISGAMAARSKGKGWSASLNWSQRGLSSYHIRLSGPLGSGTVLITRSGGAVTLRDGPKTASSSNAESLLKQQTGLSLPVTNLYYWVRGIPAPGAVQGKKYDSSGHLLALRQGGYAIDYQRYTTVANAALPSSIRLQGNGLFIKLVIKKWRV